jgi:hypothetical protein
MFPLTEYKSSSCPTSSLAFVFLMIAIMTVLSWDLIVTLIYISFMAKDLNIFSCIYWSFLLYFFNCLGSSLSLQLLDIQHHLLRAIFFSPKHVFGTFIQNKMTVGVWTYFCISYFICLHVCFCGSAMMFSLL